MESFQEDFLKKNAHDPYFLQKLNMNIMYICSVKKLVYIFGFFFFLSLVGFSLNKEIACESLSSEFQLNHGNKADVSTNDNCILNHSEPLEYAPTFGTDLEVIFDTDSSHYFGHLPIHLQNYTPACSSTFTLYNEEPQIFLGVSQIIFPFHYHW